MKAYQSAICGIFCVFVLVLISTPVSSRSTNLLGAKQCTWGPTYWCSNITNAKSCGAVHHCIQTVWEKQNVTEDNDSICQICLDMVKQARDQLESNETQNDLKLVFEGSCKLIPIKVVQKECMKLADDFIPEMIETLASQMNPQVVCSVAGLCNNANIDKMLSELPVETMKPHIEIEPTLTSTTPITDKKILSCSGCNNVATLITNKFKSTNSDDILESMLRLCGKLSSFSDACSNIILTYFNDIYQHLQDSMSSESICHISGVCSSKFHTHPEIVEIRPMSDIGVVAVKEDIPCELCEQLVGHLRDLLVANTTESEFKQVLEGLCKQTKGFKKECLSIVQQYYDVIYKSLVDNLDANGACFLIGVCPKGVGSLSTLIENYPIMPLLPVYPPAKIEVSIREKPLKKKLLGENEPKFTNAEINAMQLPIDRLMGPKNPKELVENGQFCAICEYFMHFVQEALSTPVNEEKIKHIVSSQCNKFPTSLRGECVNFINIYGDAIIALLVQQIDPRQVCPELKFCPQNSFNKDMEVFAPQPIVVSLTSTKTESTSCPLCLFAITQAQEMIHKQKTKEYVKTTLEHLCSHAPKTLQAECVDFVDTYYSELVEMLITDFTPQQICVYLKVCTEKPLGLSDVNINFDDSDEDIMTNEIPDNTINGSPVYDLSNDNLSPQCYICKKIISEALKHIMDKTSPEEIINQLKIACKAVKEVEKKCDDYIDKYGKKIANLITQDLTTEVICTTMLWCLGDDMNDLEIDEAIKIDIIAIPSVNIGHVKLNKMTAVNNQLSDTQCTLCEFIMTKLEQELKDKKTQEEIKEAFTKICSKMPKSVSAKCNQFVTQYADLVLDLLDTVPPKEICTEIQLCPKLSLAYDEVVECGVCHGAVDVLIPKVQFNSNIDIPEMISEACENVPAKYYGKCSDLIAYYGESILNLIKSNTEQSKICAEIGQCFQNEQSQNSFLKITGDIQEFDMPKKRQPRSTDEKDNNVKENDENVELVGSNKCSWGPSHWCEKKENADACGTHQWCVDKKKGYAAEQSTA